MNNLDKAEKLIDEWTKKGYELNSAVGDTYAIPRMLAAAGLLAPDFQKPDNTDFDTLAEWFPVPTDPHNPVVWTKPGGTVMVQRLEPGDLTPAEARSVALALIAAANYAEEQKP